MLPIVNSNIKQFKFMKMQGKYYMQIIFNEGCPECIEMGITEYHSPWHELNKEEYERWKRLVEGSDDC